MELRKLKDKATEAFAKGRFSKAAEFYEEYCEADPKDHQARLRMGDAWTKAGQREKAISAYQGAAEGFAREGFLPRAIAASKLILELDPSHRGVQQMLADLYARRGTPVAGQGRPKSPSPSALSEAPEPIIPPPPPAQARVALESGAPIDLSDELPPELALSVQTQSPKPPPPNVMARVQPPRFEEPEEDSGEVLTPEPLDDAPAVPTSSAAPARPVETAAPPRPEVPAAAVSEPPAAKAPASTLPPGLAPRAAQRPPPAAAPSAAPPSAAPPSTAASSTAPTRTAPPSAAPSTAAASSAAPPSTPSPSAAPSTPLVTSEPAKRSPWVAASPLLTSPTPGFTSPATSSAPPGLRQRRAGEPEPTPASPFHELTPEDGMPRASISVSSFTELELEADTLLHAVEMAALAGMRQRAAAEAPSTVAASVSAPVTESDEETVFSLTEEFVEDAPSLDALPNIPLFSDLPRDAFIELFERCPLRRFGAGELILEQGSQGDSFYVICEGRVRVFREDNGERKQIAILEGGAFFGEMAILSGAPRTASVESADEDAQLLEISAAVLADLSGRYPQVAKALKKFCRERLLSNVMNNSPLFRVLGRKDRRELIERFRARDVRRTDVIIRDGEQTDGLYVVLSGEVEVHKQNQLLTRLKEGDLFGEISLLQKTPATATVSASRHTTILRLPREDFDRLIMSYPQILALVSELTDERLRRTEQVLGGAEAPKPENDDELILV
jgi:CRP-like cAMP-binding protein